MRDFDELLAASAAVEAFKADAAAYRATGAAPRVEVDRPAPRVKVVRVLAQLLHAAPALRIERVRVSARAGCSDFRGSVTALDGGVAHVWDFVWDCRWRAEEAGLLTPWGNPDQQRAAREWDWECFEVWEARAPVPATDAAAR